MKKLDVGLLILVSAIWGSSYIFMKILSPIYGPYFIAFFRLFIGGILLNIYCLIKGYKLEIRNNYKVYLVIGLLNCALPTTMFTLAALYLDASLSVIFNSLTPIFAALYGIYFLKENLNKLQVLGLIIAFSGVVYISLVNVIGESNSILFGLLFVLVATNAYALSNIYVGLKAKHIHSTVIATSSMTIGSLFLMPIGIISIKTLEVSHVFEFLMLGLFCTGVAYVIYYYLVKKIGAKALSTTFLQPIFGVIWSVVFLNEVITLKLFIGFIITITGVILFLSKNLKRG